MCPMRLSSRRKPTTSWYWNYGARATSTVLRDLSYCFQRIGEPQLPKKTGEMCHSSDSCREKQRKMTEGHGIGGVKNAENGGHLHRHSKGLDDTSIVSTYAGVPRRTQTPRKFQEGSVFHTTWWSKTVMIVHPNWNASSWGLLDSQKGCPNFEKHLGIHRNILKFESSFCMMNSFQSPFGVVALAAVVGSDPEGRWILFLESFRNTTFFRQRSTVSECLYLNLPKTEDFHGFSFSLPNI